MIGVVGKVRDSIFLTRNAIIREIARLQKPILDRKIDKMLKEVKKTKRIMVKYLGIGKGIGRRIGSTVRKGRSLLKRMLR